MDFKEKSKTEIKDIINKSIEMAQKELKDYPNIPEHYSVMMKHPNLEGEGVYSEIDRDIKARLRRCDTYANKITIYKQALYRHARQELETKGSSLKKEVEEISKQHRVLTRAARLCEDPEAKKAILDKAESLKESPAVKDYNQLVAAMESYSGVAHYHMSNETILALENRLGYITSGDESHRSTFPDGEYFERPEKIQVNFENMDTYFERFMKSHPAAKEKSEEELHKLYPSYDLFEKSVLQYGKDVLEDTLNSRFSTLDERLDLIIINGQTLREMVEEDDGIKGRSKEEINDLSCNLLTAALKAGARVEAFTVETDAEFTKKYYAEPVPMVANKPQERVTMTFWEKFLALFGFHKEKSEKLKEQEEMDKKMEACRERVKKKLGRTVTKENAKKKIVFSAPMTKEEKQNLKIGREIAEKNLDNYVREARNMEISEGERIKLKYSFFPEEGKSRDPLIIKGVDTLVRDQPLYYCVYKMLERGIPYEEVLDSTKHTEMRVEIGKELKADIASMTPDEFDRMHIDSTKRLAKEMDKFAKEMSKEIKTANDINVNFPKLFLGTICAQVLGMDNYKNKEKAIEYCGGQEVFDALNKKVGEASNIYTLSDLQRKMEERYNRVLRGGMGLESSIGNLMLDKLQKVGIVEGLNSKDPSFNPKVDMMDLVLYQGFMEFHPEVLNLKEKVNTMDKEFLNDLLATGGEKYANMKVKIYDNPYVNTTNIGPYRPGEANLRVNVIINGKEIAQLEDPEAVMEAGRSM